jgi:predicted flap endonuclease-1-like 5' DNA nuclease
MHLIILQSQTIGSATFEIVVMLLGAGIIAAITTYLYCKAKYGKEIRQLNLELDKSLATVKQLEEKLAESSSALKQKDVSISQLEDECTDLKKQNAQLDSAHKASQELYLKAVAEIEENKKKLHNREMELQEKDEVLHRISEKKHLLDYKSFGQAKKGEKDDLKKISGIGPFLEEKLNMLDIYTFRQISSFSKNDIGTVNEAIEFFPGRIVRDQWVEQAKELAANGGRNSAILEDIKKQRNKINFGRIGEASKQDADDLTLISGIGAWIQQKLNALGIFTYQQIANFTSDDENSVTEAIEFFPGRIDRDEWVPQAKELVHSGGKRTELFERMKSKKHRIDFAAIGIAHKDDAQDLTRINGIGTFIQEKLHFLGIYTYEQISKLTPADIDTVTDIIEFFPGRIERDNWVDQAKQLAQS